MKILKPVLVTLLALSPSAWGNVPGIDASDPQSMAARQLAAKALGDDARDLVFIPVTPCTVWDTRFATHPASAGMIGNGQTKRFYSHLDGAGGSYAAYGGNPICPETAQNAIGFRPFAVMMTVYVNDAQGNGWLTFYRDGDADPSNATISVYYTAGPTRTQTVITKSSRGYGSGLYDIAATSRFGNAHAAASITGYFVKVAPPGSGNAFLQGGNAFGATAALGTTDNFGVSILANNATALRILPAATPNLIGGFAGNQVEAGAMGVVIGGGGAASVADPCPVWGCQNQVYDDGGVIAGGVGNLAGGGAIPTTTDRPYATVGGGFSNYADARAGTIAGGEFNSVESGPAGAVGGGAGNFVSAAYATIAGGQNNRARAANAAVIGGEAHINDGLYGTIGGGYGNEITGPGELSTIAGGVLNVASGTNGTIGGGEGNAVSGESAMVPGGLFNTASGETSFAAGKLAKTETLAGVPHAGAFVWADSNHLVFRSTAPNEFSARATGGVRFVTAIDGTGAPTGGVAVAPGGGSWSSLSDVAAKRDLRRADGRVVLEKVAALPIHTWSYRSQDAAIRHIGPSAQDFHAAFAVGESELAIATVDADGVALAAIQGLAAIVSEKEARIRALESALDRLSREVEGWKAARR